MIKKSKKFLLIGLILALMFISACVLFAPDNEYLPENPNGCDCESNTCTIICDCEPPTIGSGCDCELPPAPYIIPTGIVAQFGQMLYQVSLPTDWVWVNPFVAVGNIGTRFHWASFTLGDFVAIRQVMVLVEQAMPIYEIPSAITTDFRATLSHLALPHGWRWEAPTTPVGNVGTHVHNAVFTTPNIQTHILISVTRGVTVIVEPAVPNYTIPPNLTASFGQTLNQIYLPYGWSWLNPQALVGNAGTRFHTAVFSLADDNFIDVIHSIIVTVNRATPVYIVPTNLTAVIYGAAIDNIILPTDWSWVNPNAIVTDIITTFKYAVFTPIDTNNFYTVSYSLPITVAAIQDVSAGMSHSMILDEFGNIWSWGSGARMGLGNIGNQTRPRILTLGHNNSVLPAFTAISAGDIYSVALCENGNVWTWGQGILGHGGSETEFRPRRVISGYQSVSLPLFKAISAGEFTGQIIAIDISGNLWTWGWGLLGHGGVMADLTSSQTETYPRRIVIGYDNTILPRFIAVSTSQQYSIALDENGRVWTWGIGVGGELGHGLEHVYSFRPRKIETVFDTDYLPNITAISAGFMSVIALDNYGNIWHWGASDIMTNCALPQMLTRGYGNIELPVFIAVGEGMFSSMSVCIAGNVWTWSWGANDETGHGYRARVPLPRKLGGNLATNSIKSISIGSNFSLAVDIYSRLWSWGREFSPLGHGTNMREFTPRKIGTVTPNYVIPRVTATFGDSLGSVVLPAGWQWLEGAGVWGVGNAGNQSHWARYTPQDTVNFVPVYRRIIITVERRIPNYIVPEGLTATEGQSLNQIELPARWAWNNPQSIVGTAGVQTHYATYTPQAINNNLPVTRPVEIYVIGSIIAPSNFRLQSQRLYWDGAGDIQLYEIWVEQNNLWQLFTTATDTHFELNDFPLDATKAGVRAMGLDGRFSIKSEITLTKTTLSYFTHGHHGLHIAFPVALGRLKNVYFYRNSEWEFFRQEAGDFPVRNTPIDVAAIRFICRRAGWSRVGNIFYRPPSLIVPITHQMDNSLNLTNFSITNAVYGCTLRWQGSSEYVRISRKAEGEWRMNSFVTGSWANISGPDLRTTKMRLTGVTSRYESGTIIRRVSETIEFDIVTEYDNSMAEYSNFRVNGTYLEWDGYASTVVVKRDDIWFWHSHGTVQRYDLNRANGVGDNITAIGISSRAVWSVIAGTLIQRRAPLRIFNIENFNTTKGEPTNLRFSGHPSDRLYFDSDATRFQIWSYTDGNWRRLNITTGSLASSYRYVWPYLWVPIGLSIGNATKIGIQAISQDWYLTEEDILRRPIGRRVEYILVG